MLIIVQIIGQKTFSVYGITIFQQLQNPNQARKLLGYNTYRPARQTNILDTMLSEHLTSDRKSHFRPYPPPGGKELREKVAHLSAH